MSNLPICQVPPKFIAEKNIVFLKKYVQLQDHSARQVGRCFSYTLLRLRNTIYLNRKEDWLVKTEKMMKDEIAFSMGYHTNPGSKLGPKEQLNEKDTPYYSLR